MAIDAIIRNLEIIGEAAKNIPDNVKKEYSDIPWKKMIGLRNITIHEYFGVDVSIIWKIIATNIPQIRPKINKIVKSLNRQR